ncbi:crossover junction endodeoxyribonuclease RuvC [Candidatus Uhrbacteria bacterium]|nr:crossover junction endodeoxyribonuclease RuvC [Candidatus Uhrbacteria bacterium]
MGKTHRILGVDPGFGRLGFGCIETDGSAMRAIDYGIISTKAGGTFSHRLRELGDDFVAVLQSTKPQIVVCETLFFSMNVKTAIDVAQARGVILYLCEKQGIPLVEFGPGQIKSAVTGSGRADKKGVAQMVCRWLSLPISPKVDDAADALAIAITAAGLASTR